MKYKAYYYTILLVFMFFFIGFPSYAEEKDMNVNLTKDAGAATFYFEFDAEQNYEVTITCPNGETVSQFISGVSGSVTILDPRAGNYSILITSDEEISVSARVEVNSASSTALGESGVSISTSITGLSLYFIDGSIAGNWNDTNLGKVNVVVTNPKNMQVLHNVTVEGTNFILSLPDEVQEIEVYIVPASSAKVNGAGVTYTLPVIRNLDVEIHLPEDNLTNQETTTINVRLGADFSIEVIENKITVYQNELSAGEHDIEIPLNSIDNDITLYVMDGQGNIATYSCKIQKDIIAPTLKLSNSYDKTSTRNEEIEISGIVTEADMLFVNGEEVEIPSNGRFTISCRLDMGENEIIICAMDRAGNESLVKICVDRVNQSSMASLIVSLIPVGIIVFVGYLLYKKRYREEPAADQEDEIILTKKREKKAKKSNKSKEETQVISDPVVAKALKMKKLRMSCITIVNTAIVILSIYVLTHICFFTTFVASGSMEPTLKTGDIVIYNKLYYVTRGFSRGDIVCLWSDAYNSYIAKRIIGLPGDEIDFHDGYLFINGNICQEEYIPYGTETNGLKTFSVPEGHIFILGDNRENSVDSRYWIEPYVDMDNIVGKYFGTIPNPLAR